MSTPKQNHRPWTPTEVDMLQRAYPDQSTAVVAAALGRCIKAVYQKAKAIGLQKSSAFLASERSGRIQRGQQHPSMVASQFKPGQQPWNKGTNFIAGGRSAETRFQKGRKPSEARNYAPIGSYRLNHDGHLEQKMTDDPSLAPTRRWTPVYRLVWERERGPIPAGHMVTFKPGQKTAVLELITAERLECISRAENARRNHPVTKSPELFRLYQLKGAITRQVNRITHQATQQAQEPQA
jgi:hypothetical protein